MQHNVAVNLRRPLGRPCFPERFIERHDLAGRQVTSRAEEDPGIADSDGDVVVGNDGRDDRMRRGGDFDLVWAREIEIERVTNVILNL